jgi:hypothetical protein
VLRASLSVFSVKGQTLTLKLTAAFIDSLGLLVKASKLFLEKTLMNNSQLLISLISLYCNTSFSESDKSNTSQNLDDFEEQPCGVVELPCRICRRFLHTNHFLARQQRLQLETLLANLEKLGLSDYVQAHMRDCRLAFYLRLGNN